MTDRTRKAPRRPRRPAVMAGAARVAPDPAPAVEDAPAKKAPAKRAPAKKAAPEVEADDE